MLHTCPPSPSSDGSSSHTHSYLTAPSRFTIRNVMAGTMATATMPAVENCVCCFEELPVAIRIQREPVCQPCVEDYIVPKFFDALKHEAAYPVTWGRGQLHPKSFAAFITDSDKFLQAWEEKMVEYNTPVGVRLYCQKPKTEWQKKFPAVSQGDMQAQLLTTPPPTIRQHLKTLAKLPLTEDYLRNSGVGVNVVRLTSANDPDLAIEARKLLGKWEREVLSKAEPCQAFLGRKEKYRLIRTCCPQCKASVCSMCGEEDDGTPEGEDGGHECAKPSDPYEGLKRGLDYQLCPNSDCQLAVQLWDGCNWLRCANTGCGRTEFCFLCGVEAGHDSGHWAAGGTCPRFGRPDDERAIFDEPEAGAGMRDEPTTAADIIAFLNHDDAENADDHEDVLEQLVEDLPPLPPLPQRDPAEEQSALARLTAEMRMAGELLATEYGQLMIYLQSKVDAMLQIAEAALIEAENNGTAVPPVLNPAIDLMLKLRINLDVLVWRERVAMDMEVYRRRGLQIRRLFLANEEHIRQFLPGLSDIVVIFANVVINAGLEGDLGMLEPVRIDA